MSDIHVLAVNPLELTPRAVLNKRLLGGANLLLKRKKTHDAALVSLALNQLDDLGADHIAITGDVSNLSLRSEFEEVRDLLMRRPRAAERISVIPGNHDAYTHQAVKQRVFEHIFEPLLHDDLPHIGAGQAFPFCHLRGPLAIIGLSSAIASAPMLAIGRVDDQQLRDAASMLEDPEVKRRVKVVMIHHPLMPPTHLKQDLTRRLLNADEVCALLRAHDVHLVIHGHNHFFHHFQVPHTRGQGTMHICEAGSTTVTHARRDEAGGKFNLYTFDQHNLLKIETFLYSQDTQRFTLWKTFEPE